MDNSKGDFNPQTSHSHLSSHLINSISAQSALNEWRTMRRLLADAIHSYLAACATLRFTYARSSHQQPERHIFEKTMESIDSELPIMSQEEEALRNNRILLSKMRNQSTALSRVNSLPPEVLTDIFALSSVCCVPEARSHGFYHAPARVCALWRQIAVNSPNLWDHIDLSPGAKGSYELARLLFERTDPMLVSLHVYEPYTPPYGESTPSIKIKEILNFLAPLIRRVRSLDLDSESYSRSMIKPLLELWMTAGSAKSNALYIYRPKGTELLEPDHRPSQQNSVMSPLRVLHLQYSTFNWHSASFHGLVDLRLDGLGYVMTLSTSQLVNVLSMSPKLVILKLSEILVTKSAIWGVASPIVLDCLEVLSLWRNSFEIQELILSLIAQPNASAQLNMSVRSIPAASEIFEAFCLRSHIATLYCEDSHMAPLLRVAPGHVFSLVLCKSSSSLEPITEEIQALEIPDPFSHLSRIIFLSYLFSVEDLVQFVSDTGVRTLQFDCCRLNSRPDDLPLSQSVRTKLLEAFPGLDCVISGADTTEKLPCRTMFDR